MTMHLLLAATLVATAAAQPADPLQLAVDRCLTTLNLSDVYANARNGHVLLTGSVPLLQTKLDAESRLGRLPGVRAVEDRLRITAPPVDDAVLQTELEHRLHSKAIKVDVKHDIVRLRSAGISTPFALAAISRTAKTPGVQGIINNMVITPDLEVPPATYSASTLP